MVAKIPAEAIGELFYKCLLSISSELSSKFELMLMPEQSRKLTPVIAYIIKSLDNLESIKYEIDTLAQCYD